MVLTRHSFLFLLAVALLYAANVCPASAQDQTYNKEILPILQKHCISCHHKGGTAPQSFETYKEVKPWIRSSVKTVNDKSMPPWQPDAGVGKWKNTEPMTDAEIAAIVAWGKAKGPEGDAAAAPKPLEFKPWSLGTPDKVLTGEEYKVPGQGGDIVKQFTLDPGFKADTWLTGIEINPGALPVVQHAYVSILPNATAKLGDPGSKPFGAVWTRGINVENPIPEGAGILVPAGGALLLSLHYKTNGEEIADKTEVGLFIAKAAPAKELKALMVSAKDFEIPAGAVGHKLTAEGTMAKAGKVYGIYPMAHYLGKTLEVTAGAPLLKIADFNYDLTALYAAAAPIALAAGTKVTVTATYDNTRDNPHNPNMNVAAVKAGYPPTGEACGAVLLYTED